MAISTKFNSLRALIEEIPVLVRFLVWTPFGSPTNSFNFTYQCTSACYDTTYNSHSCNYYTCHIQNRRPDRLSLTPSLIQAPRCHWKPCSNLAFLYTVSHCSIHICHSHYKDDRCVSLSKPLWPRSPESQMHCCSFHPSDTSQGLSFPPIPSSTYDMCLSPHSKRIWHLVYLKYTFPCHSRVDTCQERTWPRRSWFVHWNLRKSRCCHWSWLMCDQTYLKKI